MASDEDGDVDISSVEFTLEDTYEYLKDLVNDKKKEVENLMEILKNNEVRTFKSNVTPDEIRLKRLKYITSMEKIVTQEEIEDNPIPNTSDFYTHALQKLEEEVEIMEEIDRITDNEIIELETDIANMERKKIFFEQTKEACLNAIDNDTTTNYEAEVVVTKRLFQDVKKDLGNVVETLFPVDADENGEFQQLLLVLTRALNKGGDDLYIDVTPESLGFVNFLEEADIIQFHPNDKTKIKLRNL